MAAFHMTSTFAQERPGSASYGNTSNSSQAAPHLPGSWSGTLCAIDSPLDVFDASIPSEVPSDDPVNTRMALSVHALAGSSFRGLNCNR